MDTIGIEIKKDSWAAVRVTEGLRGPRVTDSFALSGPVDERLRRLSGYVREKGLTDPFISVCLPRGASLVKAVEVAAPNRNAVEGILRFELDKHLPVAAGEASVGIAVLGKSKNFYTALLAASPKKEAEGVKELFAGAGFQWICVHAWQASFLNALARCGNVKRGRPVIALWIKKEDVSIEAFSGDVPVFSRCLKTGGQRPEAWAGAMEAEFIFTLRSAIRKLGAAEECVIVSDDIPGDGFFMSLQSRLGIPVHAEELGGLEVSTKYALATGAALANSMKGGVNASLCGNFRPKPNGRFNMAVGAAAATVVLLAGLSYAARDHIALNRLDAALIEAGEGKERAKRLADEFKSVEGAVASLRSIDGAGPNVLDVMTELSALLPDEAWLTGFEMDGETVLIEGYSKNASSLMLRMEGSKVLGGHEFAGPVTRGEDGRERFRIRLKVKGIGERPHGKMGKALQAKAGD